MTPTAIAKRQSPRLCDVRSTEEILAALAVGIWEREGGDKSRAPIPSEEELAGLLFNGLLDPNEIDEASRRLNGLARSVELSDRTGRFEAISGLSTANSAAVGGMDAVAVPRTVVAVWTIDCNHPVKTQSIPELHACWVELKSTRQHYQHPLVPLVRAWLYRPRQPAKRHIISPASCLVRAPAIFGAAFQTPLRVIEVDGKPLVTAQPSARPLTTYRQERGQQTELLPQPKRIAGVDTGDMIIRSLSQFPLSGDERSLVRSDAYRLGLLGYALTGPLVLSEGEGILLLTGREQKTESATRRWWITTETVRTMSFLLDPRTGEWADFMRIGRLPDGQVSIMAPAWWNGRMAWRLSGGLFRPALMQKSRKRGPQPGYWGGLHRMIAGIESALSWGASAGRGKDGRIPDNLRPACGTTGPGPSIFIEWSKAIYLSGEPVSEANRETARRRYSERQRKLKELGYEVGSKKSAPAGDTWEIVKVRRGSRWRKAGIVVRATDRFTEAVRRAQNNENWERRPVSSLLARNTL